MKHFLRPQIQWSARVLKTDYEVKNRMNITWDNKIKTKSKIDDYNSLIKLRCQDLCH